jgi:hypothetical protein
MRESFKDYFQPGRTANNSSPSSAEVENEWRYTSTPPYASMAQCLTPHLGINLLKPSGNFTYDQV